MWVWGIAAVVVLGVCAWGISDVNDDVMKLHFWR